MWQQPLCSLIAEALKAGNHSLQNRFVLQTEELKKSKTQVLIFEMYCIVTEGTRLVVIVLVAFG